MEKYGFCEGIELIYESNYHFQTYPCTHCAEDFREDLKKNPPTLEDKDSLSKWMCEMHNRVNVKIGKEVFDCTKVRERWLDGWKDGSCDPRS